MPIDSAADTADAPTDGVSSDDDRMIKCLVWDLDETLWDGTLAEDPSVSLRPEAAETIRALDQRGILHSIASRNDHEPAMEQLKAVGLDEYFLYPQINWGSKADSVAKIAEKLNLGLDTFAFIDDQPFERDEVEHAHPEVLTIDADEAGALPEWDVFTPRFVTPESAKRRQMYQSEIQRTEVEESFDRPKEEFLATLDMEFTIKGASEDDLQRAEELTVRTNQLNATGYTYSYDELDAFRRSDDHALLVTRLDDKYGTYGTIGLALLETHADRWRVKLLLMSCRVMSRGVGTILMNYILQRAQAAGVPVEAEFVPTDRNRQMYVTYKFAGFTEAKRTDDLVVLRHDAEEVQDTPEFVDVQLVGQPLG
jgi:FkbH-like protein